MGPCSEKKKKTSVDFIYYFNISIVFLLLLLFFVQIEITPPLDFGYVFILNYASFI